MFSFSGFLKTLGIVLLVFIALSFVLGFVGLNHMGALLAIMYFFCYLLAGVLAPMWNKKTPYFSSFMLSVTLTVLNLVAAIYLLDVMVLADPAEINSSLVYNTALSLLATFVTVKIMEKRGGETYA
ncbi:hypothetical protein ACQCT6_12235 [Cytobacillus gottheilii]|uniref:hypothetical protein n=1 Tax=Cytobacillus gottheilii TaxID=859144 RepID=UPI000831EF28|nr:hypothetical protein [Cytobacillus gottheilii]